MTEYNWDNGFAVPLAVLDHPKCERATASLIFFDSQGPWTDQPASPEHGALLTKVRERLLSGALLEERVSFNPGLTRVQRHQLQKRGVSDELLRPSGPR
jgi:hypothetical protein